MFYLVTFPLKLPTCTCKNCYFYRVVGNLSASKIICFIISGEFYICMHVTVLLYICVYVRHSLFIIVITTGFPQKKIKNRATACYVIMVYLSENRNRKQTVVTQILGFYLFIYLPDCRDMLPQRS